MKEYFKRLWYALWASTKIDEKAAVITPTTKKKIGKKPFNKNKKKTKTNNNTKK